MLQGITLSIRIYIKFFTFTLFSLKEVICNTDIKAAYKASNHGKAHSARSETYYRGDIQEIKEKITTFAVCEMFFIINLRIP